MKHGKRKQRRHWSEGRQMVVGCGIVIFLIFALVVGIGLMVQPTTPTTTQARK